MTQVAYALRADYTDVFAGGVLNVDGDFDVAHELERGNGFIVVDTSRSALLAAVLDDYPALKRVPVSHALNAREKTEPRKRPARSTGESQPTPTREES